MKFTRAKFGGLASKDHRINVPSLTLRVSWLVRGL